MKKGLKMVQIPKKVKFLNLIDMKRIFFQLFELTMAFASITFIILFIRAMKSDDMDFVVFYGIIGLLITKLFIKMKTP